MIDPRKAKEEIAAHWGHQIVIANYLNGEEVVNATIECLDCGTVLIDSETMEALGYVMALAQEEEKS